MCSICLDSTDDKFIKTVCQHNFHEKCLQMWLDKNNVCPLCRKTNPCNQKKAFINELIQIIKRHQSDWFVAISFLSIVSGIINKIITCNYLIWTDNIIFNIYILAGLYHTIKQCR